jgi:hypothetical protein
MDATATVADGSLVRTPAHSWLPDGRERTAASFRLIFLGFRRDSSVAVAFCRVLGVSIDGSVTCSSAEVLFLGAPFLRLRRLRGQWGQSTFFGQSNKVNDLPMASLATKGWAEMG